MHMNKKECRNKVHCDVFTFCCSNKKEPLHCWEMAQAENDFHFLYNICADCIVYLYSQDNDAMPKKDIEAIMLARVSAGESGVNH